MSSVTFFATCTTEAPSPPPATGNVVTLKICPSGTRDLGAAAPGRQRMRDGAVAFRVLAEANFGAGRAVQAAHVAGKVGSQRGIAAEQDSVAVEHGDGIADRVERPLPLLLAPPHHVVQPGVLNRDRDLPGHSRDEALIRQLEPVRRRGAERQRADQIGAGHHRHADRAQHRQVEGHAWRQSFAQVVDDVGRAVRDDVVARSKHRAIEPRPLVHVPDIRLSPGTRSSRREAGWIRRGR